MTYTLIHNGREWWCTLGAPPATGYGQTAKEAYREAWRAWRQWKRAVDLSTSLPWPPPLHPTEELANDLIKLICYQDEQIETLERLASDLDAAYASCIAELHNLEQTIAHLKRLINDARTQSESLRVVVPEVNSPRSLIEAVRALLEVAQ
jgi:phage shock protein A